MQTREIPISQWQPFLDQFSQGHQGEKVTVTIVGRDIGEQTERQRLETELQAIHRLINFSMQQALHRGLNVRGRCCGCP